MKEYTFKHKSVDVTITLKSSNVDTAWMTLSLVLGETIADINKIPPMARINNYILV
jgi:hypothetical protein